MIIMENRQDKIKKQSTIRLVVQCISFAFHNGYVRGWAKGKIYSGSNKMFCIPGLNCYSCPGAIGACPIGSLQAVLGETGFNISLYVIGFIGIVGVLCGRLICGWLCPFGLVQDLFHKIPLFKKVKNMPGHKYLRYLRFVVLAVFVIALPMSVKNQAGVGQPWFCEFICPSGTLLGGIPLVAANESLQAIIGFRYFWKIFLLVVILIASIKFDRPFCKYICPLGALYGMANPISIYRLKVDDEKCVQCGECQHACGVDIKVWENPNSIDCIRCGKCKVVCPTGAITSTFTIKHKEIETLTADNEDVLIGKGRTIAICISSVLAIILSGYALSQIGLMIYLVTSPGSIESTLDYFQYVFGYIVAAITTVMTFVLGIKALIAKKTISNISELSVWPKRNLRIIGICFAVTYFGYVIYTIMLAKQFVAGVFAYPIQLMLASIVIYIMLVIVNFILQLSLNMRSERNLNA